MFARRQGKSIDQIPGQVIRAIERYSWPGNIRQLQNFIERSVILTKGTELQAPIGELTRQACLAVGEGTLADADRRHIIATLCETNWVVGGPNGAAVRLGLNRTTLLSRMRKLGITRGQGERRGGHLNSFSADHESNLPVLREVKNHRNESCVHTLRNRADETAART